MKELNNDLGDVSREAAQNIRIAFDDRSWDKMETLLDDDDREPAGTIILKPSRGDKSGHKYFRIAGIFSVLLFVEATVLFIRKKIRGR